MSSVIERPIAAPGTAPDRASYLGGSDAAAVMGVSPWTTPVELWEYKTRRKVREDDPSKARIYKRGHKLEPFIREMAVEKLQDMGLTVAVCGVNQRYQHPAYQFLAAEIDFELMVSGEVEINGELVAFEEEHINVDAKSVTGFARKKWGDVGSDEVPIEYAAQFMHGMMVTGRRYCLVAALRSFDDVDLFWVVRDDETIEAMLNKEVVFWDHVLEDTPPDPVNFADLKALFPAPKADLAEADAPVADKVAALKRIKAAIKDLEEQAEGLTFEVAAAIGEASGLTFGGKPLCTWNAEGFSRLDQKGLKAAHPEICEQFTLKGRQRVLRLK